MPKLSILMAALAAAAMIAFMAPNILERNRGNILRNIALWLAIIVALTLVYTLFVSPTPGVGLPLSRR